MKISTALLFSVVFLQFHSVRCSDAVIPCNVTDDCASEWLICEKETFKCEHKEVFPVLPYEVGGIIILILLKMCLSMAGIGGGSLVVALAMALFGFTTKPSIAISSFATFISTLGAFFVNFRLRHPEKL